MTIDGIINGNDYYSFAVNSIACESADNMCLGPADVTVIALLL